MERKIQWISGVFDEIELVYEKAEANGAASLLADLEAGALAEARENCHILSADGKPLTPGDFDNLPEPMKEQLIAHLSGVGLEALSGGIREPRLTLRLSPMIQAVLHCTAFSILNRLEKLDGAINVLHPEVELEIQAPLGGKKGLLRIEMLIAMLYPWLRVREGSSNAVAATFAPPAAAPKPEPPKPEPPKPEPPKQEKSGFWARLFGKK